MFATDVLLRPRVLEQLAWATQAPITVILAPAGYGKSTALQQYLASRNDPSILFAARPDDKTLIGFARGLLESSATLSRAALSSLTEAHASAMRSGDPGGVLADWMTVFLHELPSNILIAIDDVHFASADPHTTRFVAALVESTRHAINWLIAIRSVDDLPVAEWLAHGDMQIPVDRVDLAFTADEIRDLASALRSDLVADMVPDLWIDALEGWPIAVRLALRSGVPQGDFPAQLTADELFALLADRFFATLSDRERTFLIVVSKLRSFDSSLFVAAGVTDADELSTRLTDAGVLVPYGGSDHSALRLHDLFAVRFDQGTHLHDDETWLSWTTLICDLLAERERLSEALELCMKLNDVDRAASIVSKHGFSLWAHLHADLINRAVAFVNGIGQQTQMDPIILAVQAVQLFRNGNVTDGTRLHSEAIRRADDPLTRARIVARLMVASILTDRLPPIDPALLEVDTGLNPLHLAEIASARTLQLAVAGCYARARELIAETIDRLQHLSDGGIPLIQYCSLGAGFASYLIGDFNEATEYSELVVRTAYDLGQPALLTFAYTILSFVAMARGDEIDILYRYTNERARNEWRSGCFTTIGVSRFFQLICAVAAGNDVAIAAREHDFAQAPDSEVTQRFYTQGAKDLAIRYTWDGSFREAQRLAAISVPKMAVHEDLVRLGALAMFAAAAGQRDEALATIARAEDLVRNLTFFGPGHTLQRNHCRVYEALAMMILNNEAGANGFLQLVDGYTGPLVAAIEAVARGLAERNVAQSHEGRTMLRRRGYLGYARMLEQVERCVARARAGNPVALASISRDR